VRTEVEPGGTDWRRQVRAQTAAAVAAAVLLADRRSVAMRHAQALHETAAILRQTSQTERVLIRRARERRARTTAPEPRRELIGFTLEGLVDGEPVSARWANGTLQCDPPLRERALLLVDMGEEFVYPDSPRCLAATLDGRPVAVALTLIRACNRVVAFEVDLPRPGPEPPAPSRTLPARS